MQKIRFPMEYLRVTQGRNIGSHLGTKAMDFGGKDTGSDKLYAPCDMKVIRNRANASGEMYCESVEKVLFADGTEDYVNFTFIHDSAFNVPVGTILRQGEYFYDEGGMGSGKANAFAIHVHVEAGRGKFGTSNPIQVQTPKGTWHTNYNPKNLEDVFWLGPDVIVMNDGGYSWKVDVKETEAPPAENEDDDTKAKIEQLEKELQEKNDIVKHLENQVILLEANAKAKETEFKEAQDSYAKDLAVKNAEIANLKEQVRYMTENKPKTLTDILNEVFGKKK